MQGGPNTGSVLGDTDWYFVVLGQYKLVLLSNIWYRVRRGLTSLYILKKVEIWSGDTNASHTHSQTTEYNATQLV